jgi:hypothetical protein
MGPGGPYGCEMLRIPHFLDNRFTDGGEVIRPKVPGRFLELISIRVSVDSRAKLRQKGL